MARWVVPWLAIVVLCTAVAVPAGAMATVDRERAANPALGPTQGEFDNTEFVITVYENGSGRWTFLYKKQLNETEKQQFEEFAATFNNKSDPELYVNFKSRARSLTAQGTNVTDRSMEARNFHKNAYVTQIGGQGVVKMSFTWTNFAATQGDRVVVGDVFEGGLYIGPNQVLKFHPGSGLVFSSVNPNGYNQSGRTLSGSDTVVFEGPRDFSFGPTVEFAPPSAVDSPTDPASRDPSGAWFDRYEVLPWLALAVVVLVGLAGAFAYRSGSLQPFGSGSGGGSGGSGGAGAANRASSTGGSAEPAVSDEELLSDEDRVIELLKESGGRMKQVNIVDETGWSKSKVSMLLSEMEDEEHISKLRVGRENIISLKGEEPEAAGSPFEQEPED